MTSLYICTASRGGPCRRGVGERGSCTASQVEWGRKTSAASSGSNPHLIVRRLDKELPGRRRHALLLNALEQFAAGARDSATQGQTRRTRGSQPRGWTQHALQAPNDASADGCCVRTACLCRAVTYRFILGIIPGSLRDPDIVCVLPDPAVKGWKGWQVLHSLQNPHPRVHICVRVCADPPARSPVWPYAKIVAL